MNRRLPEGYTACECPIPCLAAFQYLQDMLDQCCFPRSVGAAYAQMIGISQINLGNPQRLPRAARYAI